MPGVNAWHGQVGCGQSRWCSSRSAGPGLRSGAQRSCSPRRVRPLRTRWRSVPLRSSWTCAATVLAGGSSPPHLAWPQLSWPVCRSSPGRQVAAGASGLRAPRLPTRSRRPAPAARTACCGWLPLAKWVRLDLSWAEAGETSDLGHLLGLAAVRYVAVPVTPSDEGLIGVLARQVDLYPVGIDPSYAVYENSAWVPMLGRAPASTVAAALAKDLWRAASLAVRPGPAAVALASSKARAHAFYGAVPPGTWGVRVAGRPLKALRGAVGASVWFAPSTARAVELGKSGEHAGAAVTLALWAAALAAAALSKDKRRGAELAKVPAVAERSELVLAGRGP